MKMDKWKLKEIKQMELGGNKNALQYFQENDMFKDGRPDHLAPQLARYKQELAAKAEAEIKASMPQTQQEIKEVVVKE